MPTIQVALFSKEFQVAYYHNVAFRYFCVIFWQNTERVNHKKHQRNLDMSPFFDLLLFTYASFTYLISEAPSPVPHCKTTYIVEDNLLRNMLKVV
jgi:hypothetical protein